ncbi:MAG: hypothetical protein ACPG62_10275 [Cycloclasticus sp.]
MSDFKDLKNWFFLQDAAKYLSGHFDKEFSINDLFQAALESHLSISWYVMGKPALPAGVILPAHQVPELPIPNADQAELLNGAYKIKLDDIEINKIGNFNFRNEWLMNLARNNDPVSGTFSTSGFFIEDNNGNLWRPLEYRATNKGVLSGSSKDEKLIEIISPEGYYPKICLPDEQELIIRKIDLNNYMKKLSSLNKNQSKLLNTAGDLLSPFHAMEKLRFKEITIVIDPDSFTLRISARKTKVTAPFNSIGIFKSNQVSLNAPGKTFMAMANGRFSPEQDGAIRAQTRLSVLLRNAFKTEDPPFIKRIPQFCLRVPKNKEAKRQALKRTTRYDDNKPIASAQDAQDFLRLYDPEFDPDSPTYASDNKFS